jgi:hypothetical protein
MPPQHQVRYAMERSAPYAVDILRSGQRFHPSQHFACGPIGKRREHYPLRCDTLLDQISDPVRDRTRFPRSRTRDNERRFRLRSNNAKLPFVQLLLVTSEPFRQAALIAFKT